ncbi:hypothetical protein J2848_006062 [Azospirillum lipoferum]|uniref:Response receiver domain-containing protein n=1 Tax=Azospirillum lipoferum TaxID=193 RepID=A0A5A9GE71_AZOLI|nr:MULTISPECIES: response regulator receiver domain [Azospirillum]KAA0592700.1 hypothetical protein FZ942_26475 [Azospirillum lipoferum]MCP1614359.1 hypothetical protein [Azospirillum lipoferum]MDW5531864.1 response regulator receiver domain [Azospirillum sp. NL1]
MTRLFTSLRELRQDAVEAFVRTAILIDNEPLTEQSSDVVEGTILTAQSAAYRPGAVARLEPSAEDSVTSVKAQRPITNHPHQLSVRPVTNAFAGRRITCGFYFPSDEDADIVETAFSAAKHVDVTILDWQLRVGDTAPAKELIVRLLKDDQGAGGRLRLIVVYTGERPLNDQCTNLHNHLISQGFNQFRVVDEERGLHDRDVLIAFANKPTRGPQVEQVGPAARPIAWSELPQFVLEQFGNLAQGLLQAFSLKSIGAVRDDTHHLLSVFSEDLDGAYLAQRAGIGSPTDAEEMMVGLLASEFVTSIADREIGKEILGSESCIYAVKPRNNPEQVVVKEYNGGEKYKTIVNQPKGKSKFIQADDTSLQYLARIGLDSGALKLKANNIKHLKRQFFDSDAVAEAVLAKFARLTLFTRESDGVRKSGKDPIALTGGVIVRRETRGEDGSVTETYLLCMQPGCDAVRLSKPTAFPFCKTTVNDNCFDLVVHVNGVNIFLLVDRRPKNMSLIEFEVDLPTQVVKTEVNGKKRGFWTKGRTEFWEFVAELRPMEAQNFTSQLVGQFNRVALNGSEWLRLSGNNDER